jgi:CBS domain-containing membrane protein
VLDGERRVVGIVTLVDFLKHARLQAPARLRERLRDFLRGAAPLPREVGRIMTASVVTASADMHIVELVPLLSDKGFHHIPVVDAEQKLAGMVTQSDLIAALYTGDVNR